jgi:protein TonB
MSPGRDAPRAAWAFSLAQATALPLRGEEHPLRREFSRLLLAASLSTSALLLAGFALWRFAQGADQGPDLRPIAVVRYTDLGVPPSIARPAPPQINVAEAIVPPEIAVPEPVPDEEVTEVRTIATQEEMSQALEAVTTEDLGLEEGEPFVVEMDAETSPSPDEFIAVDEEPVRINIDPPVYPEMARSANVEGTVLVRVLVGVDGKVKNALLLEGHQMLVESALACARTAVFRPALIQHRPVEVWVVMPVIFKLN